MASGAKTMAKNTKWLQVTQSNLELGASDGDQSQFSSESCSHSLRSQLITIKLPAYVIASLLFFDISIIKIF